LNEWWWFIKCNTNSVSHSKNHDFSITTELLENYLLISGCLGITKTSWLPIANMDVPDLLIKPF